MIRSLAVFFGKLLVQPFVRKNHISLSNVRKILVFKPGMIGDVLMATPFLRVLRKQFPNAEIVFFVGAWSKDVLKNNSYVDRVEVFDEKIVFGKNLLGLLRLLQRIRKEKFDLAFGLEVSYLSSLFLLATDIPVRVGFDRFGEGFPHSLVVPYGAVMHASEYYLELAYAVGAKRSPDLRMDLFVSHSDKLWAKAWLRHQDLLGKIIIGIAPGGSRNPGQLLPYRRWPVEKFVQLSERILKHNAAVLLIGGGSDRELEKYFFRHSFLVSAMKSQSIQQTAALLAYCKVLVTNDSGPMHIAAAVGTPVLSLFGPTDPRRKAPIGKQHFFVWDNINNDLADVFAKYPAWAIRQLQDISVDRVWRVLQRMIRAV